MRNLAGEALGRLCNSSGNTFTTTEVNYLVDQIVANREPNARSGYAVALGCIHSQLGGMAAGYHLKNILSILMSLGNDPHPVVHFWALESLSRVADSAGLTFSGYVQSTLGMLAQLYAADTHNEESTSLASSNFEVDLPSPAVIAHCIDSTINVLGPDLQDMAKARDMIMTLLSLFKAENDDLVVIESLKCQEHISLYAPGHMEFSIYVKHLQQMAESSSAHIRDMAVDGLHNLMRRNTEEVLRAGDSGLEDQLWHVLDRDSEHEVVRNVVKNWLHQTGLSDTAAWVQRFQTILTKTKRVAEAEGKNEEKPKGGMPDLQDEEVAGFAATSNAPGEDAARAQASQELLKWQVRTFAMDCLSELLAMVSKEAAFRDESPCVLALQQRVADVVRIAFSASTAGVVQLRIRGLKIIDQVLKASIPYNSAMSRILTIYLYSYSARLLTLTFQKPRCWSSIRRRLAQLLRQLLLRILRPNSRQKLLMFALHSLPLVSSPTLIGWAVFSSSLCQRWKISQVCSQSNHFAGNENSYE